MVDFLDALARDAKETINAGYYDLPISINSPAVSLKKAIVNSKHAAVIAEIKPTSPSIGTLHQNVVAENFAIAMKNGGAIGISILTEPKHFNGALTSFMKARKLAELPLLMKDIIVSPLQLDAAAKVGANAILLIQALFTRGYCECDIHDMIRYAHIKNLEVLLEVHSKDEFSLAVNTDADLVGINNRDLRTLKVDLGVTKEILNTVKVSEKIVVSESGIKTPDDIRFLHKLGARAFLIGSAIMTANNVEKKVKEFVNAL